MQKYQKIGLGLSLIVGMTLALLPIWRKEARWLRIVANPVPSKAMTLPSIASITTVAPLGAGGPLDAEPSEAAFAMPETAQSLRTVPIRQMILGRLDELTGTRSADLPILKRDMLAAIVAVRMTETEGTSSFSRQEQSETRSRMRSTGAHNQPENHRDEAAVVSAEPDAVAVTEADDAEAVEPLRLWRRLSENPLGELEINLLLQLSGTDPAGTAVVLRQHIPVGWEIIEVCPEPQVQLNRQRVLKWLFVPETSESDLLIRAVVRPITAEIATDVTALRSEFRYRLADGGRADGVSRDLP